MRAAINGAELCVDTVGDPADPDVLLIMGGAASMDRWEDPFCERLAAAGRHVIRYDHRDTGGSTTWPPGEPGYTGAELTLDALGVLDHLGVERAHVVGFSMGGGIAQELVVDHPARVRSVTLIATTLAEEGGPDLPGMSDELRAQFAGDGPPPPDWGDREATIAYWLEVERPWSGRRGLDVPASRALLGRLYDRSPSPASADNNFLVEQGDGLAAGRLGEIRVPALVIHGGDDPMFPPAHGEALARAIPGARLVVVPEMGHELPRFAWDAVLDAIVEVTAAR
jgi:pimeloyl-ACP methyl ester carboxylesterase